MSTYNGGRVISRNTDPMWGAEMAFAERLGFSVKAVRKVGVARLCYCRSDEARRILLRATEKEMESVRRANLALYMKRRAAA